MLHSLVYIKFTRRNRNWRATRIHNTQFHWVGRGHRGHAYLIENKWTSQGGPTGDERENRWESLVGYRRWALTSLTVCSIRPMWMFTALHQHYISISKPVWSLTLSSLVEYLISCRHWNWRYRMCSQSSSRLWWHSGKSHAKSGPLI